MRDEYRRFSFGQAVTYMLAGMSLVMTIASLVQQDRLALLGPGPLELLGRMISVPTLLAAIVAVSIAFALSYLVIVRVDKPPAPGVDATSVPRYYFYRQIGATLLLFSATCLGVAAGIAGPVGVTAQWLAIGAALLGGASILRAEMIGRLDGLYRARLERWFSVGVALLLAVVSMLVMVLVSLRSSSLNTPAYFAAGAIVVFVVSLFWVGGLDSLARSREETGQSSHRTNGST